MPKRKPKPEDAMTTDDRPAVEENATPLTVPPTDVKEAAGKFVDDVVKLTNAQKEDVTRFAAEYLPLYAQYSLQAKSSEPDEAERGNRMLGHIKSQVALRACIYGIQLEQSALEALWGIFNAAVKVV